MAEPAPELELERLADQAPPTGAEFAAGAGDEPAAREPSAADRHDAEASAELVAWLVEQQVTELWPFLEYSDDQRQAFRARLAPVLLKYGGEFPPWLVAWREELQLAWFLGVTAFGTWRQVRAFKADQPLQFGKHGEPSKARSS